MKIGEFDRDTGALQKRLEAHSRFGSRDLNTWIFEHLDLTPGLSILDLGCGTGKQTLPLAQAVGPKGKVLAVDISQAALDDLQRQAREQGLAERIATRCLGLDAMEGQLEPAGLDRVVSSYAVYYVEDPRRLFRALHQALKDGGIFFACGPALDNNADFLSFYYNLVKQSPPPLNKTGEFMEKTAPGLLREIFGGVDIFRFENPMRFDSADALLAYWSSHNLYDRQVEAAFRDAAGRHFRGHPEFVITKRAVGLRAKK
ncbi:MAG: class I SAM-dependent methyltransferase [Deltaproteobacteria bacterium]|nr:MAG: class I SAM-dependent methyltransferase [Deltaproteobacteria bacterium]